MITPGGRVGDASPLGHKGGPRQLDDYVRAVAHALMRKNGWDKSHAIAVAKNSLKKWRRGGGHVRPQVRAGAAAHLAVQEALDKRRGGGHNLSNSVAYVEDLNLSATFGASSQDGVRVTQKIRPGSIKSGPGKGKFPIQRQTGKNSVESATKLVNHAKGVKKARVKAHIIAEAKKRGLKVPEKLHNLSNEVVDGEVDLAHWRHGWIPLDSYARRIAKERKKAGLPKGGSMPGRQPEHLGHGYHLHPADASHGHRKVTGPSGEHVGTVKGTMGGNFVNSDKSGAGQYEHAHIAAVALAKKHKKKPGQRDQVSLANVADDIELGSHGSKWRHGWIPLNPTAAAIKAKKFGKGGSSSGAPSKVRLVSNARPSGIGRVKSAPSREQKIAAARSALRAKRSYLPGRGEGSYPRSPVAHSPQGSSLPGPKSALPHDKAVDAYELSHNGQGELRTRDGKIVASGFKSKRAASIAANRHNAKVVAERKAAGNYVENGNQTRAKIDAGSHAKKMGYAVRYTPGDTHTDGDLRRQYAYAVKNGQTAHVARTTQILRQRGYVLNTSTGKWSKPRKR